MCGGQQFMCSVMANSTATCVDLTSSPRCAWPGRNAAPLTNLPRRLQALQGASVAQISCAATRACFLSPEGRGSCLQDAAAASQETLALISAGGVGRAGPARVGARRSWRPALRPGARLRHHLHRQPGALAARPPRAPPPTPPWPAAQSCWGAVTAGFSGMPAGAFVDVAPGADSTCAVAAGSGAVRVRAARGRAAGGRSLC